eukprot:763360-Pyramimonas_sp.AAC.1
MAAAAHRLGLPTDSTASGRIAPKQGKVPPIITMSQRHLPHRHSRGRAVITEPPAERMIAEAGTR